MVSKSITFSEIFVFYKNDVEVHKDNKVSLFWEEKNTIDGK